MCLVLFLWITIRLTFGRISKSLLRYLAILLRCPRSKKNRVNTWNYVSLGRVLYTYNSNDKSWNAITFSFFIELHVISMKVFILCSIRYDTKSEATMLMYMYLGKSCIVLYSIESWKAVSALCRLCRKRHSNVNLIISCIWNN